MLPGPCKYVKLAVQAFDKIPEPFPTRHKPNPSPTSKASQGFRPGEVRLRSLASAVRFYERLGIAACRITAAWMAWESSVCCCPEFCVSPRLRARRGGWVERGEGDEGQGWFGVKPLQTLLDAVMQGARVAPWPMHCGEIMSASFYDKTVMSACFVHLRISNSL